MCKFCEAMQTNKQIDFISRMRCPDISYRYSVAIVRRIFVKGRKGCRGSGTDYRFRGCGYKLNYCPECGVELGK